MAFWKTLDTCNFEKLPEQLIISILNAGKRKMLEKPSYRGINLLNVMGKVFERLFLNRWMI